MPLRTVRQFADERFWRELVIAARQGKPGAVQAFLDAVEQLKSSADLSIIREILSDGRQVAARVQLAFDFEGFKSTLAQAVESPLAGAYRAGAAHGLAHSPPGVRTTLTGLALDPEAVAVRDLAVEWARKEAGVLVVGISDTTRQGIGEVIQASIRGNFGRQLTAGEIRGLVGITPGQESILERYVDGLNRNGDLTPAKINRLREVKYNQLLNARSEVIADTELRTAAVQGQRGFWRENKSSLSAFVREIVAVLINSCPFCIAADGAQAEIDGEYEGELGDGPLFHPL